MDIFEYIEIADQAEITLSQYCVYLCLDPAQHVYVVNTIAASIPQASANARTAMVRHTGNSDWYDAHAQTQIGATIARASAADIRPALVSA